MTSRRNVFLVLMVLLAALLACKSKEENPKMGQPIKFDDSQWEVVSAKDLGNNLTGLGGNKTTAGKFIKVEYKVTNLTTKEESILDHPKLIDAQKREFGPMEGQSLYMPEPEQAITLESLPPSMLKRFSAIYEVPADAKGFMFETRALSAFGDRKKVDLGF